MEYTVSPEISCTSGHELKVGLQYAVLCNIYGANVQCLSTHHNRFLCLALDLAGDSLVVLGQLQGDKNLAETVFVIGEGSMNSFVIYLLAVPGYVEISGGSHEVGQGGEATLGKWDSLALQVLVLLFHIL